MNGCTDSRSTIRLAMRMENPNIIIEAGTQFCSLAYNAGEWREDPSGAQVILIAALDPKSNRVHLRVRSDWMDIVAAKDEEHIASLLTDCQQRASGDPIELFHQLCSLNLGPLQTFRTGLDLRADPSSSLLYGKFQPL